MIELVIEMEGERNSTIERERGREPKRARFIKSKRERKGRDGRKGLIGLINFPYQYIHTNISFVYYFY